MCQQCSSPSRLLVTGMAWSRDEMSCGLWCGPSRIDVMVRPRSETVDELAKVLEKNNKLNEAVDALESFLRLQVAHPSCARASGGSETARTKMRACAREAVTVLWF